MSRIRHATMWCVEHGRPAWPGDRATLSYRAAPTSTSTPDCVDRALQALAQRHRGLPAEDLLGQRDVGLALLGVVGRQRLVDDLRASSP